MMTGAGEMVNGKALSHIIKGVGVHTCNPSIPTARWRQKQETEGCKPDKRRERPCLGTKMEGSSQHLSSSSDFHMHIVVHTHNKSRYHFPKG